MKTRQQIKENSLTLFNNLIDLKDCVQEQKFEISNEEAQKIEEELKNALVFVRNVHKILTNERINQIHRTT